jgi:hypothetical protein
MIDKQHLMSEIKESLSGFIELYATLDEKRINDSPGEGIWSAGELGQHVVLATQGGMQVKTKSADRPYDKWVDDIRKTFLDFDSKFKSPSFLVPEHTSYSKDGILRALKHNLQIQLQTAQHQDLTKVNTEIELPGWGALTGYEWMKLMIYHVQRHTVQLKKYV